MRGNSLLLLCGFLCKWILTALTPTQPLDMHAGVSDESVVIVTSFTSAFGPWVFRFFVKLSVMMNLFARGPFI